MIKFVGRDECVYEGYPSETRSHYVGVAKHRIELSSTWQGFLWIVTGQVLGVEVAGRNTKTDGVTYTKKQIEDAINKVVLNNTVQYLGGDTPYEEK